MSLFQFTRRSIWVTSIIIETLAAHWSSQYTTDRFSFMQVLHWPPPILIPLFGALCIVFGDTKQLRKYSGALFVIGCLYWCVHDWKPKSQSIMNKNPSHSCIGLWRKLINHVHKPHSKRQPLRNGLLVFGQHQYASQTAAERSVCSFAPPESSMAISLCFQMAHYL